LLNGVLRAVQRDRERVLASVAAAPLAIRESFPDCLVDRWQARVGPRATEALCCLFNTPPDVVLCPLTGRADVATLQEQAEEAGIALTPHPAAPDRFLVMPRGVAVERVPGYDAGTFIVQDPAAREAVRLLDVRPGARVLDACAAPGGKLLQLATAMGGEGRLVAMDVHEDRLEPLRQNLRRTGQGWVTVCRGDARREEALRAAGAPFDRVLLDVPCSNTGVLRRRADARWRFSPERLQALVRTQRALLDAASLALAPGGRLVYSTCSLEPEENGEQIAAWAADHPDFECRDERTVWPTDGGTDGAYAAVLARR
jgi:16S rRNA (cytosine967-C5)-methyltransferase